MCYWILWHCACGKKYGVVEVAMEWRARVAEIRVEVEGRPSAPNFNPFIPRRTVQHRFTSSRRLTGVENGNVAEEAVEWCGRVAKIWVEVDGRPAVPNSKLIILRQYRYIRADFLSFLPEPQALVLLYNLFPIGICLASQAVHGGLRRLLRSLQRRQVNEWIRLEDITLGATDAIPSDAIAAA